MIYVCIANLIRGCGKNLPETELKKKTTSWGKTPFHKDVEQHDGAEPGKVESQGLPAADPHIWKSRISWRITLTVFAVILFVQGACLYSSTQNFEAGKLAELRSLAQAVITQHIVKTTTSANSRKKLPFDLASADTSSNAKINAQAADQIIASSPVKGIAVYGLDHTLLSSYGEEATLQSQALMHGQTSYRSTDLSRYEVILPSSELESPFNIVATIDSSNVQPAVMGYIQDSVVIFILTAGLVTSILMIALGQWLLQPILTLRRNLLNASKNPKNPEIQGAGREGRDEIGITLRIANGLIRKNASNIKQMERQTEEKIHRLAYYDTLTGLPNRTLFMEKLEENIKRKVKGEDMRLSVFAIDIDHFSDLNNTMGHEIGDRLLEAVGRRLLSAVSAESVVSRLSADEFAVMTILDYADENGSAALESILKSLVEPVNILQEEFKVRVSIGVATCPDDGHDSRNIMKNADIALNRAKSEGRDTVRYYSEDLDHIVHKRFRLLSELREALQDGQLKLHFQPQFDLTTGAMIGSEALLRWERPDNSPEGKHIVPPEEFVQIAEQTGLIIPIGEWVLQNACQTNKHWRDNGGPVISVAVNISSVQFHHGDLVKTVSRILRETGLEARYLELEITESVFMEDMVTSIDILRQLHELGVRLSIDDFGTGYSSLSSLRLFPVDRLKIDPSFVRNALINEEDAAIVKTIITLGHSLGIKVLAEGVETNYHVAFLKNEGCDEAQGFKYSRPIPADKFLDYAALYKRELVRSNIYVISDTGS